MLSRQPSFWLAPLLLRITFRKHSSRVGIELACCQDRGAALSAVVAELRRSIARAQVISF